MLIRVLVLVTLAASALAYAGGDCCLDYRDCYAKLKACEAYECEACETCAPCEPCAPVVREVPIEVPYNVPVRVPVRAYEPKNALGGGLAAFFVPNYFNDYNRTEYGPALSYERIWPRWVLHVGVSAAEVPVSNTVLDWCSGYASGGGHWYPCLSTMTDDEWLYQANLMLKRRF